MMIQKSSLIILLLVATILLMFSCVATDPKIIYVDSNAATKGDGKTWSTAYTDLQDALDDAIQGDEIWVAAGIYRPTRKTGGDEDRHKSFQLRTHISIYGGFDGNEFSREERDWQSNETILSGNLNGNDNDLDNIADNSYHVVIGNDTDSTAILDGFTITAGNASFDTWPDDGGGGMSNHNGSPTIANCLFIGNNAFADGGGIRNWGDSKPIISNCTFRNNKVAQEGGGVMNGPGSSTVITNCKFIQNSAGEDGGGMYNNESNPLVTNCVFHMNSADLTGGGMYNVNSSISRVVNCSFNRNVAASKGGGISNKDSNPIFTNCILWENVAPVDPEISNDGSIPDITYCNVEGSYAGIGNIDLDPLFADTELRLSEGSKCIDTGNNAAIPRGISTDLDAKQRIINMVVDLGAYEFGN